MGTLIVADSEGTTCPEGLPCFSRDKTVAKFKDLLFVTPDKNLFTDIWSAKLKQCTEQTDVKVPLLCSERAAEKGLCQQETGFAQVYKHTHTQYTYVYKNANTRTDASVHYPTRAPTDTSVLIRRVGAVSVLVRRVGALSDTSVAGPIPFQDSLYHSCLF